MEGINGTKHNYSNPKCKEVLISISKNLKYLYYDNKEPMGALKKFFKGRSYLNLSDLKGVTYGAMSATFATKKERAIKEIERVKKEK